MKLFLFEAQPVTACDGARCPSLSAVYAPRGRSLRHICAVGVDVRMTITPNYADDAPTPAARITLQTPNVSARVSYDTTKPYRIALMIPLYQENLQNVVALRKQQ